MDPEAICYVRQLPGVARRSSWSADPCGNACTESLPQRNESTNTYSRCLWPTTKTSCVICLCVAIRHKCIKLKASASNFKVQTSKKAESRLAGHRIDDSDVRVCLEHDGGALRRWRCILFGNNPQAIHLERGRRSRHAVFNFVS